MIMMKQAAADVQHMPDGQPDAREQEPDDIADRAETAGPDILSSRQVLSTHRLLPKGQVNCPMTNRLSTPGNADDGNEGQQAYQPPSEPHQHTAHDEPGENFRLCALLLFSNQ